MIASCTSITIHQFEIRKPQSHRKFIAECIKVMGQRADSTDLPNSKERSQATEKFRYWSGRLIGR